MPPLWVQGIHISNTFLWVSMDHEEFMGNTIKTQLQVVTRLVTWINTSSINMVTRKLQLLNNIQNQEESSVGNQIRILDYLLETLEKLDTCSSTNSTTGLPNKQDWSLVKDKEKEEMILGSNSQWRFRVSLHLFRGTTCRLIIICHKLMKVILLSVSEASSVWIVKLLV